MTTHPQLHNHAWCALHYCRDVREAIPALPMHEGAVPQSGMTSSDIWNAIISGDPGDMLKGTGRGDLGGMPKGLHSEDLGDLPNSFHSNDLTAILRAFHSNDVDDLLRGFHSNDLCAILMGP
jgi:hypothetical protein